MFLLLLCLHLLTLFLGVSASIAIRDILSSNGLSSSDLFVLDSRTKDDFSTFPDEASPYIVCMSTNNPIPLYQRKEKLENSFKRVLLPVFIDSVNSQQACYYGLLYPRDVSLESVDYTVLAFPALMKIHASVVEASAAGLLWDTTVTETGPDASSRNVGHVLEIYVTQSVSIDDKTSQLQR